jgi:hypothetical protein
MGFLHKATSASNLSGSSAGQFTTGQGALPPYWGIAGHSTTSCSSEMQESSFEKVYPTIGDMSPINRVVAATLSPIVSEHTNSQSVQLQPVPYWFGCSPGLQATIGGNATEVGSIQSFRCIAPWGKRCQLPSTTFRLGSLLNISKCVKSLNHNQHQISSKNVK